MKIINLFLATFLVSSVALASADWTIVGPLKPHESVVRTVELESGKITVEAWSSVEGAKVSCRYSGGMLTIEQTHTDRCSLSLDVGMTSSIKVQVINEADRQVDYRIWVHDTKN